MRLGFRDGGRGQWYWSLALVLALLPAEACSAAPPEGEEGPRADALVDAMLEAVNAEAWSKTRLVQWTFPGGHRYLWDRSEKMVRVGWKDKEVLIHTPSQTSVVVRGKASERVKEKAWSYFCNDSFWLAAPFKVRDPGTRHALVEENGEARLLVTYGSGGVTPGDRYLWRFDQTGRPAAYNMWVKIIPVGGLGASWEGWRQLESGAWIATEHKMGPVTLRLGDVRDALSYQALGEVDPFGPLRARLDEGGAKQGSLDPR